MIGDTIKVHLPGEAPWAEVVLEVSGMVKARIINELFHEHSEHEQAQFMKREFGCVTPLEHLHAFKRGDKVWFKKDSHDQWVSLYGH